MEDTAPILVAIAVVVVIGGVIVVLLRRSVRDARAAGAVGQPERDVGERLSTADQRFRLLSFQGGSQPADLSPVLEELRRNGIEVDEATLRRKLAEGAAAAEEAAATAEEAAPTGEAASPADQADETDER